MSGMDVPLVDYNETAISPIDNGTFLRSSPTSSFTSAAASSPGRPGNVYVYVWLFLGLLVFLLTLLIISLHRLKNIISSSSSVPDFSSEGGSSFTNMEICSISSQRSTISSLSTWWTWGGYKHMCPCSNTAACMLTHRTEPASAHCDPNKAADNGTSLCACFYFTDGPVFQVANGQYNSQCNEEVKGVKEDSSGTKELYKLPFICRRKQKELLFFSPSLEK